MDRDNNLNKIDVDFEKINAANWYYHQVTDNVDGNEEFNIENFVNIINNYKLN